MVGTSDQIGHLKSLPLSELQKLRKDIERSLEQVFDVAPHLGYRPHPGQYRFVESIDKGVAQGARQYLAACGNGWGKSFMEVNLIWAIMCPPSQRNPFFDFEFIRNWKFPKHLRLLCNAKQLKEGTGELWKAINRWWPKDAYKATKQGYDFNAKYEVPATGFVLDVMTFDQEAALHESVTLGGVFCDEPPPYHIWKVYPARFRHGGIFVTFATLIDQSEWIEREIIESERSIWTYGDIEENCRQCSRLMLPSGIELTGHLDHHNIEEMIDSYVPEEREARRTGKPIHRRGAVFDINPAVHYIDRGDVPEDSTTYLSLDPHQRRPWVLTVGAVDRHDNMYIVDEWPREDYSRMYRCDRGIQQYVELIDGLQKRWRVREMIIDGKFAKQTIRRDWFSTDLRTELEDAGLFFIDGDSRVEGENGGTAKLKDMLRYDKLRPISFSNRPKLFICRDLYNSCYGMRHLSWREDANPDRFGRREQLDDTFLDYPRCIMYLAMHDGGYRVVPKALDVPARSMADLDVERRLLKKLAVDRNTSQGYGFSTNARHHYADHA